MALPGEPTPTTLRDALATAVGDSGNFRYLPVADKIASTTRLVDRWLAHPAMQTYLRGQRDQHQSEGAQVVAGIALEQMRKQDAALVDFAEQHPCTCWAIPSFLSTVRDRPHADDCLHRIHAAAIAAARARLR